MKTSLPRTPWQFCFCQKAISVCVSVYRHDFALQWSLLFFMPNTPNTNFSRVQTLIDVVWSMKVLRISYMTTYDDIKLLTLMRSYKNSTYDTSGLLLWLRYYVMIIRFPPNLPFLCFIAWLRELSMKFQNIIIYFSWTDRKIL